MIAPRGAAGPLSLPFAIDIVEEIASSPIRYRDAIGLPDDQALLVMTDFVDARPLDPSLIARCKDAVRRAGSTGQGPDLVLSALNQELFGAGLSATATCARLDARDRLVHVASAGAAPPFVIREQSRAVRAEVAPTILLGRVRAARFTTRSLHFDRGDTLVLASDAFVPGLEGVLGGRFEIGSIGAGEWLRHRLVQPPGGSILCLTLS